MQKAASYPILPLSRPRSRWIADKAVLERRTRTNDNRLLDSDRSAHDWYRFVLSFPPHLVRGYLERFEIDCASRVLDPFCGTGTTLVEYKKQGIPSVGVEANPVAYLASRVKLDWSPDPDALLTHAQMVAESTLEVLRSEGIDDEFFFSEPRRRRGSLRSLSPDETALLLRDSISPLPLHKTLVLLEQMERQRDEGFYDHERLALAKALVVSISNLHFGPEVGVGPAKLDAPVVASWLDCVGRMARDVQELGPLRPPHSGRWPRRSCA